MSKKREMRRSIRLISRMMINLRRRRGRIVRQIRRSRAVRRETRMNLSQRITRRVILVTGKTPVRRKMHLETQVRKVNQIRKTHTKRMINMTHIKRKEILIKRRKELNLLTTTTKLQKMSNLQI